MNKYAYLLREIYEDSTVTQRELADTMSISLGSINNLIKDAISLNYLYKDGNKIILTKTGLDYIYPLTFESPNCLL